MELFTTDILAVLQGALVRNDYRIDTFYDNNYSFILDHDHFGVRKAMQAAIINDHSCGRLSSELLTAEE